MIVYSGQVCSYMSFAGIYTGRKEALCVVVVMVLWAEAAGVCGCGFGGCSISSSSSSSSNRWCDQIISGLHFFVCDIYIYPLSYTAAFEVK
jgi:hypothetical protein